MDKGLNLTSVVIARDALRNAGIRACYFLQLGYPGETWAELRETISFVRETRPDDIGVSFSYPLPGTVFYERVREQLGRKRNWTDSDDLCIMFKAAYTTDFYLAVRDALHAEVDSWNRLSETRNTKGAVENLWKRVRDLEPVSREENAFTFASPEKIVQSSLTTIVPVEQLISLRNP
jgi:anaerobic magnesium-protoporphyrin IX monomethyl ester cyclase